MVEVKHEAKADAIEIRFALDNAISSGRSRMYTASSAGNERFDCKYFQKNRQRSAFIREAHDREFECGIENMMKMGLLKYYNERPKLWVYVSGNESVQFAVAVYRGNAFFAIETIEHVCIADTRTDDATYQVLNDMDLRGGVDSKAFQRWRNDLAQNAQQAIAEHRAWQALATSKRDNTVN